MLNAASAFGAPPQHPAYTTMVAAAETMRAAEQVLYNFKVEHGLYDSLLDPLRTGLIGVEYSTITTTIGVLKAKRTATNPDFAAYIVRELNDHHIGSADSVLVTMTGSFPGLNVAVLTALDALHVASLRICSLGASSYGANQEQCTWLDFEEQLLKTGKLNHRSNYTTLGGSGDVGGGMTQEGRALLKRKAEKLGYPVATARSFKRQARLRRRLVGAVNHYALLINIGGNQVMLGKNGQGRELPGGWISPQTNPWQKETDDGVNGIIFDFLAAGVPVLNLLHVENIAQEAGIPVDPPFFAAPGESAVYILPSSK
jgi:poly-gamma-glutamate system protein